MAAETLRPPVYAAKVIFANTLAMTPEWYRPLANLFARVLNLSQVTAISTPNVTPAANVTASPVTSPDATAPGAAYNQATATTGQVLVNELKADVNTLTTEVNTINAQLSAAISLLNEIKAAHNSQTSALNP